MDFQDAHLPALLVILFVEQAVAAVGLCVILVLDSALPHLTIPLRPLLARREQEQNLVPPLPTSRTFCFYYILRKIR